MAWVTPATMVAGQVVTAANMNEIINDLIYLKVRADYFYVGGPFTTGVQTVLPAGSITEWLWIHYHAWNDTGNTGIGATSNTNRQPGGADLTLSDAGPTNTIVVKFPANGSVTVERTLGSVTWGISLILLYR